jgi:hypothetical protein
MSAAILASFVPVLLALGTWQQPFLRRNGPKTRGEGGRPHAPRGCDRMESKITSGVHAARSTWRLVRCWTRRGASAYPARPFADYPRAVLGGGGTAETDFAQMSIGPPKGDSHPTL